MSKVEMMKRDMDKIEELMDELREIINSGRFYSTAKLGQSLSWMDRALGEMEDEVRYEEECGL